MTKGERSRPDVLQKKARLEGEQSCLTASKKSLTKNLNVMQSNENSIKIHNSAREIVGDIGLDEAIEMHAEYQLDNHTTICPFCESSVSEDQLLYVVDDSASWEDPAEAHNECPHCRVELSASSLEKPDFETWLKVTV